MVFKDISFIIEIAKRVILDKAYLDKLFFHYYKNFVNKEFVKFSISVLFRDIYFAEDIIKRYLKDYKKLPIEISLILYLGSILIKRSKYPYYVILNELVEFTKRKYSIKYSKLVNAVLRRILNDGNYEFNFSLLPQKSFYYKKLYEFYQDEQYFSIVKQIIFVDSEKYRKGGFFVDFLKYNSLDYLEASKYSDTYFYIKNVNDFPKEFLEKFVFQDIGNHLLMKYFSYFYKNKNSLTLEIASYPGGKSFYLFSNTIHNDFRLWKVNKLKQRLKDNNRLYICSDGRALPFKNESFDYVFLDTPCTGSGVVKTKVDIIYHLNRNDYIKLRKMQKKMLKEAWRVLKKGGFLFYSTCSIFKDENERRIEDFLRKNNRGYLVTNENFNREFIYKDKYFFTIKKFEEMDGIFGAVLLKT